MSLSGLAIKYFVSMKKIEKYDRFLFVGPHPDDIEIGAGATVSKLTAMGKSVTFLICTDGRFGDVFSNGIKGDDLAKLRKKESIESAKRLGVSDVRFLDLCDGAGYAYEKLMSGIAKIVSEIQPDIVFAPDPISKSECHLDHINVGNASKAVACFAPYEGVMQNKFNVPSAPVKAIAFYMTANPNVYVRLSKEHFLKQKKVLSECFLSQYPQGCKELSELFLYLGIRSFQYGIKKCSFHAEGFRVLDATRMHCLPEA